MANVVTLCNLALARLGDSATVVSIDPPEGSAQAEHCAMFYPIARDVLLSAHPWNFAVRRQRLSKLEHESEQWRFAFALPSDALSLIDVLKADEADDYGDSLVDARVEYHVEMLGASEAILTDEQNIIIRYLARVEKVSLFPPLFVEALTWKLAAMIAGPLIKGDAGIKMSHSCEQMAMNYLQMAIEKDSNQRRIKPKHRVKWVEDR